ncbi:proton-coupled folate transporter-like isoform X2 [Acanthaster planci]|uniref:Proton-coupled folate transporter n=1 Tax=Acanthaster planci TaxID=133434 RepID=A0A8B7YNU9_ACAPL|nr:proton-coupled folate transporter-like isoform X2 [Acanthaster planci]
MSTSTEKYLQHKVKYPCITVEPVVLVFFISYSMIVTLRAEYITLRIADGLDGTKGSRSAVLGPDDTLCRHLSNQSQEALYAETQSRASYWLLLLNLFQVVPSLVSAPLIGSWSDLGGRKRALVIPIIGYLMGSIVWIIVTYTDGKLWYLLLAEFCLGLTGDFSAVLAVCNAYLADITTERERTFRLILVGITIEVGTGASQILVGYWVVQQGFGVPFWFVVATMLASLVYITVLLKETRGKSGGLENLELFNNRLLDDIYGMFMRYSSKQRRQMMFFMIVLGVHMTILYTAFLLILLYVLSPPLCWTPITVGYYVASALLLGSAAGICGSFRFLVSPAVRSRLSKLVDEEEQGAMFSLASSIESIGHLIGPLIFNLMYGITTGIYQGFTFLVMASFYVPICFMTGYYQLTSYWISKHKTVSTSDGERMATP